MMPMAMIAPAIAPRRSDSRLLRSVIACPCRSGTYSINVTSFQSPGRWSTPLGRDTIVRSVEIAGLW
jgi:hypothetical protein